MFDSVSSLGVGFLGAAQIKSPVISACIVLLGIDLFGSLVGEFGAIPAGNGHHRA